MIQIAQPLGFAESAILMPTSRVVQLVGRDVAIIAETFAILARLSRQTARKLPKKRRR